MPNLMSVNGEGQKCPEQKVFFCFVTGFPKIRGGFILV